MSSKVPAMQIQNNSIDFDDPDNYMMLVRPNVKKGTPYFQILLSLSAFVLSIIALIYDEISDGDWYFETSDGDTLTLDSDCGWESYRITYSAYGATGEYQYNSQSCATDSTIFDTDFCNTMKTTGIEWFILNLFGILLIAGSLGALHRFGKASIFYALLTFFGVVVQTVAVVMWLMNETCSDIEDLNEQSSDDLSINVDANAGVSLICIYVSIGCLMLGLLVSSVHLIKRSNMSRQSAIGMRPIPQNEIVTTTHTTE